MTKSTKKNEVSMAVLRIAMRDTTFLIFSICVVDKVNAVPIEWPMGSGGNGHYYELIKPPGVTYRFAEAKAAAESMIFLGVQGNLASITSAEEQAFVFANAFDGDHAWIGITDSEIYGGMESLIKPNPQVDGWVWLTGEPVIYTNWGPGQPVGIGDAASINGVAASWTALSLGDGVGFVVEYAVPEPSTFILSILGLIWLGFYGRRRHSL